MVGTAVPPLDDVINNEPTADAALGGLARGGSAAVAITFNHNRAQQLPILAFVERILNLFSLSRCGHPSRRPVERWAEWHGLLLRLELASGQSRRCDFSKPEAAFFKSITKTLHDGIVMLTQPTQNLPTVGPDEFSNFYFDFAAPLR